MELRLVLAVLFVGIVIGSISTWLYAEAAIFTPIKDENLRLKKELNSLLVFLGFSFMLVSHVFFLLTSTWILSYILAHTFQLLGFLCFLVMLVRVNRKE